LFARNQVQQHQQQQQQQRVVRLVEANSLQRFPNSLYLGQKQQKSHASVIKTKPRAQAKARRFNQGFSPVSG